MELLQLRYFRSAARYQNFSRAAREHMVPQSSISITVARLEEELGCRLFDRNGRRVALNDNGALFLRYVDMALNGLDEGIRKISPQMTGTIRLAISAGSRLVPAMLTDFHREYPNIHFTLTQTPEDTALPEQMDFAVMALPLQDDTMEAMPLMKDEIQLAVPDNHPFSRRGGVGLAELKDEPFVGFHTGKSMRRITDAYCREKGFTPRIVLEAGDAATFRSLLRNRMGIGFVPRRAWNMLPEPSLVLLPITDAVCERTLALCWKKGKELSWAETVFRDFAKQWYRKIEG